MSESVHLELTTDDRDVLLRGLRFVRSSIMLECREPTPDDTNERQRELNRVASLVQQLTGAQSAAATL